MQKEVEILSSMAGQGDYHLLVGSANVSGQKFCGFYVLADAAVSVFTPRKAFTGSTWTTITLPVGTSMAIELTGMTITSGTVALAKTQW